MKSAKLFCIGCVLLGIGQGAGASVPARAQPALYSFEDVYRLALAGPVAQASGTLPIAAPSEGAVTVRVTAVQAAPETEWQFTIDPVPGPRGWLLLLAGIAAAGWVAHRRLAQL